MQINIRSRVEKTKQLLAKLAEPVNKARNGEIACDKDSAIMQNAINSIGAIREMIEQAVNSVFYEKGKWTAKNIGAGRDSGAGIL